MSLFAYVAVILAVVGVYGVVGLAARRRTGEMGIRLALGATPQDILALVVPLKGVLLGVATGVIIAMARTRFLRSLLYEIVPSDVATFVVVSLVVTAAALLAAYVPTRRASAVDPLTTLRWE